MKKLPNSDERTIRLDHLCRAALACVVVLFSLGQPAAAVVEPTQPVSAFFPLSSGDAIRYVQPYIARSGIGQVGDVVRNSVAIHLRTFDVYGAGKPFVGGVVVYTLDGVPISPRVSSPYDFQWDTAGLDDGTHVLGVILVDGPPDIASYRSIPAQVVIDNIPGVVNGRQRLPVLGNSVSLQSIVSPTPDWIEFPGLNSRPHAVTHPLPYRYSPPVAGMADPLGATSSSKWFLESLTEGNTGLYHGKPAVFRNAEGHLVTNTHLQQNGQETASSSKFVSMTANYDGDRNDNSVSPYSTYVPDPSGPGWIGIDIGGRLFKVGPDGAVRTIAGLVADRDQIPFDKMNGAVTAALHASARYSIGAFDGGVAFNAPTDLAFDPRNPSILYVADYLNHRIAKVDLSVSPPHISTFAGAPGVAGNVDGPIAVARFHEPSSIVAAPDGTLYVADQENFSIRRISADGQTVSTLVAKTPLVPFAPFAVRMNSRGDLIVAEFNNNLIRKVSTTTGALTVLARLSGCLTTWTWLDVDFRGNVGPKDDTLVVCSTGGSPRVFRISVDGTRSTVWPGGGGGLEQGGLNGVIEPAGHYPWAVAIDDEESKIVYQGFGNLGLRQLRMSQPGDPSFLRYGDLMYSWVNHGRGIMQNGTVGNFPFGIRPTFTALLGVTGHGHLGVVKNFDDLALMSDAELRTYIQGGMGGSVPRPEITGRDLDAFIYYIRINSLQGLTSHVPFPLPRPDITAPKVSDVVVNPLPNGTLEVTWNTDESAIGFVAFGTSPRYHRWTPIENRFSTTHRVILTDIHDNRSVNFSIMVRDETGNQTLTANRTYTGGNVFVPAVLFESSATSVLMNGRVSLRWASTDAEQCIASNGWVGNKGVIGSQTSALLTRSTTFDLTCSGPGGSVKKSISVTVTPPPTLNLSATPAKVASGARSSLAWLATNATGCTASNGWSGTKALSGAEQTLVLSSAKLFTLTCTGPGGTVSKAVVVGIIGSSSSVTAPASPRTTTAATP